MPKVSVVIPTCNRPDLVLKSINSVLAQTFQDFEIIVVDDGLESRAEDAVYGFDDKRIKYIPHKENKGGSAARNTGIKKSDGDFVAFLDDDDEWVTEKLEEQMALLEKSSQDVGFCFSATKQVHDDKIEVSNVPNGMGDYYELALRQFKGFLTSTLLIKKNIFKETGVFDESFPSHQEPDLVIRISKKYKGIGINKPLVRMNLSSSNNSIGKNIIKRIKGRELILSKYNKEFKKRPKILAAHLFQLAIWYRDTGYKNKSHEVFKQTLRIQFKLRYLFHYLMGLKNEFVRLYVRYKFFGLKYRCNFCGGHYRKFFSAGFNNSVLKENNVVSSGFRENIRCPYCNSSDRERLTHLYLKDKTNILSGENNILHIAPEKNLQKLFKSIPNINHISIDINSYLADLFMDINNITFNDNKFDLVVCNHVLEHIVDDKKAMKEIFRVLKPGGFAILQVPISLSLETTYEDSSVVSEEDREKHFGQVDHVRIYAKEDYKKRLKSVGFKVLVYSYSNEFRNIAKKYSLDVEEDLYVCSKDRL